MLGATNAELFMLASLIIALITVGSMPAAYDMARDRGRSTRAWLNWAMLFGPLALVALLILGCKKPAAPAH
jgi:hypothetical protein